MGYNQFITSDMRGKHTTRSNKILAAVDNSIHEHINLFPKVESHYCRQSSSKDYLEENLNISKMYSLYVEWMKNKNEDNVGSEFRYRHIFDNF